MREDKSIQILVYYYMQLPSISTENMMAGWHILQAWVLSYVGISLFDLVYLLL